MAILTEGASVSGDSFAWVETAFSGPFKVMIDVSFPLLDGGEPMPATTGAGGGISKGRLINTGGF